MDEKLKVFSKFNTGNTLICGSGSSGRTSILLTYIEDCINKNENIYVIDGEDEINKIYKNTKNSNIKSIFISSNIKKLRNWLANVKYGDTIIVDSFNLFSTEIQKLIKELVHLKKYKVIVTCINPVKMNLKDYKFIIALRTINSYSKHWGIDTTKLKNGEAIINFKNKITFPYELMCGYKLGKVISQM